MFVQDAIKHVAVILWKLRENYAQGPSQDKTRPTSTVCATNRCLPDVALALPDARGQEDRSHTDKNGAYPHGHEEEGLRGTSCFCAKEQPARCRQGQRVWSLEPYMGQVGDELG